MRHVLPANTRVPQVGPAVPRPPAGSQLLFQAIRLPEYRRRVARNLERGTALLA